MSNIATESLYDPDAIFLEGGPIDPGFMMDAIQTLMRTLPLEDTEPEASKRRRMNAAVTALASMHPRDPIEVMLAVQGLSAYHAAAACWRIGMNLRQPSGDSTRHISAAATAARTFDSMLRAIERRQATPLSVPVGRPASREWSVDRDTSILDGVADRVRRDNEKAVPALPQAPPSPVVWSPEDLAMADEMRERERIERENEGLDIANIEGIRPDGSIIMPEYPTPQQEAYIARRWALMYKRERAENLRNGVKKKVKFRPLRTGDLVP
jgi:hypothetical protein